jgi:hypothetical protein
MEIFLCKKKMEQNFFIIKNITFWCMETHHSAQRRHAPLLLALAEGLEDIHAKSREAKELLPGLPLAFLCVAAMGTS